jgi:hypothetical protein
MTYNELSEQVFIPLKDDFIKYIQSYNFIPKVRFNVPLREESSLYIEGITHLEKDIDSFQEKLNQIKKYGEVYNKNLEIFEKETIYKLLSDYFERNGFNTTDKDTKIRDKENTVIVDSVLYEILKRRWTEGSDFNYKFNIDNELMINASTKIAVGNDDRKQRLYDVLDDLKIYDRILMEFMNLVEDLEKIKSEYKFLSIDIENNTINKILKGTYKTTCPDCQNI